MKVAIVKYNAGNTASVANALTRVGVDTVITDDPETLTSADKVIFPGVGEASTAMAYLRTRKLDEVIRSLTQPVLGVCLGMHLMCSSSEENETECLSLLPYKVRRFSNEGSKVPHMGWNQIFELRGPLFDDVSQEAFVYFVHSYFVEPGEHTTAACKYSERFSAALSYKNFHAVQFHTEKSGAVGEQILENFLNI
ncbi:MAG TPA: imidazole glycerol phosphate synthase subunit HisH [Pyrinomonadaceae bacterium]|nr:imidazole glycerol phosphate synthase subunit HisH [Pyrinomonadaceae bacterium]